jgi:hypothetical protein
VVFGCFVTDFEGVGAGGVGFEEGVIEDGSEVLPGGESVSGEGCCVMRRKRNGRGGGAKDGAQWCSFGATTVDSKTLKIYEVMISILATVFFLS